MFRTSLGQRGTDLTTEKNKSRPA